MVLFGTTALARNPYRRNFFDAYPSAVGSRLDDLPSASGHCGVCHYDFSGGGARNPFGMAVEATDRSIAAILGLGGNDSDVDGYTNNSEITDLINFTNTPTFPGLTPANVGSVSNVNLNDITAYLVPSTGADLTPPTVTIIAPNGAEVITANQSYMVLWTATDTESGVASIDLHVSDDGGATYLPVALGLANAGMHTWFPANRPTSNAIFLVVATDNAFNSHAEESQNPFTIESPPGGIVPTTLRDFDMPGSQPFDAGTLSDPTAACSSCHGNYDPAVEPFWNWQGSMMAQASRDPLFEACMAIANQDAPDSGDLCLRCHIPKGWLGGRSVPTDGTQMLDSDMSGVSCDFCHRMVDPFYDPGQNPMADDAILAALAAVPVVFGNGQFVVDPNGTRRGPFTNASLGHPVLVSPFHREAAFCGTCHDVSNPAFEPDGMGNHVPNAFDAPATNFAAHAIMPIERTYSEWFYSDYNTLAGVFAPEFAGNKPDGIVHTCQDCHMRDLNAVACNLAGAPIRPDMPLHDMTGGSTWVPTILDDLFPGEVDPNALADGVTRARYMLQNAAELTLSESGGDLIVRVTNKCGHKLPTGYPEGRRIWINVRFLDDGMNPISESGAYDPNTGVLTLDAEIKVYETKPGLDEVTAPLVGTTPGPSFHFVLNNKIFKDNRIPPLGFANADYAIFGGTPIGATYADGQNWDETAYQIPPGAASAQVTLYYQSTSKDYIEFLRDENVTNAAGQTLFDLWDNNGKSPPEPMVQGNITLAGGLIGDLDGDGDVDVGDFGVFTQCFGGAFNPPAVTCPAGVNADFDGDGDVDAADFAIFAQNFTGAK